MKTLLFAAIILCFSSYAKSSCVASLQSTSEITATVTQGFNRSIDVMNARLLFSYEFPYIHETRLTCMVDGDLYRSEIHQYCEKMNAMLDKRAQLIEKNLNASPREMYEILYSHGIIKEEANFLCAIYP